jgi:hypothetical protein
MAAGVIRGTSKAPPRRTYALKLDGELEGFHVTMGAMSARDIIAMRSGTMAEVEVLGLVAQRIVTHDFDVPDPLDLDYWIVAEILRAWGVAMEEAALPPVTGER